MTPNTLQDREFFRVPAAIPVFYCPESPEARQAMTLAAGLPDLQYDLETRAKAVMNQEEVSQALRPLLTVLKWFDFKMDLILLNLRMQAGPSLFKHHLTTVDISGSGCGLENGQDLVPGQRLLIALSLPDAPARLLYAVAVVVRSSVAPEPQDEDSPQPLTALHFVEIDEVDRERIVRYTQVQQRKLIKDQQAAEQGGQESNSQ